MAWYDTKFAGFVVKVADWYNKVIHAIKASSFVVNQIHIDITGAAQIIPLLHADAELTILKAVAVYVGATDATGGIELRVGKETDSNFFVLENSESNKAQWYEKELTLLETILDAGDTLTVGSVGGSADGGSPLIQIYVWYTDA